MKKILIDGRFIGVGESISRYVFELVHGILALDNQNEYTLLIRPVGEKVIKKLVLSKRYNNLHIEVLDIKHYSLDEQTKLLKYLKQQRFDLVHFTQFNHPVFYKGDYLVTVHDLTLVGHLHYFNFLKRLAFNAVMKSAVQDSQKIIAISNTTMADVMDFYDIKKDKFAVIYHGIDHNRFAAGVKDQALNIKNFKEKYSITGDYILYTGMWKKHKNILRMLVAYEKFILEAQANSTPMPQLVLVGKVDKNEPEVLTEIHRINGELNALGFKNKKIITTGFIEEEELPIAYAGALVYCIPSLSEGFGWPPLEAMACGTPVISSKESCMPEILGQAPLYFDPYNIDDISKAMKQIINDQKLQSELSQKGLDQVKKYNWDKCAKETFEVYQEVLNK